MGKQQLYINGKAVDMPADEIKIKVESNLFSDAGSLMTAHSYSISLPRTMTNDSIFALAYVPSAKTEGESTHTYLSCSLFYDGIPLFENGRCVLVSVEESGYKCNLYWGLLGVFDEIKREGLNLCDLPMSSRWDEGTMGTWIKLQQYDDQLPQYITGMTSEIYATLDDESKELADSLPWIMPSVSASTILAKIAQVYGVQFETTAQAASRIAVIWHPLVTRKAMAKNEHLTFRLTGTATRGYEFYHIDISQDVEDLDPQKENIFKDGVIIRSDGPANRLYAGVTKINVKQLRVVGSCNKKFNVWVNNTTIIDEAVYNSEDELWHIDKVYKDISINDHDSIVALKPPEYTEEYGWTSLADAFVDVDIYVDIDKIDEVKVGSNYGSNWCYERNYPELGVINYISEILAHIGGCIVGSVTTPKRIKISTFDEIMESPSQVMDTLGVKAITMSLDKLAQKNIYTHKAYTDDGSDWEADGVIYTADTTLELERKAFDSKFKVPKSGLIRLWTIEPSDEENKQKAKWDAKGDYIASDFGGSGYIGNLNEDFASAIADYYTNYEKVVDVPKVVDVVVRLPILDLIKFDFARPIHIVQLNSTYLVKNLETENKDNYKLKLVQI